MSKTTLHQLSDLGQSAWLDFIDRPLLETGKLQKLIDQGLRGMTSNPSIFNGAIANSTDYDKKISQLKAAGRSTFEIYDELTIKDIQDACDILKPVFESTRHLDGYVSLEINPQIAHATQESIQEGKRLYFKVKRPNVMIKVPATDAGFPVIEDLIANGINVNTTLIFSLSQYIRTAESYLNGLEKYQRAGGDLGKVRSVASVFVSRIDTLIDKLLDDKINRAIDGPTKLLLQSYQGKAAVANCKLVYEKYKEFFSSPRFKTFLNPNPQRVLWASTSTKNPAYPDIKYVTELITRDTVNTIPEATLNAFLDHGKVAPALAGKLADAEGLLDRLKSYDIDINAVCAQLLSEGVVAFDKAFVQLSEAIEKKATQLAAK